MSGNTMDKRLDNVFQFLEVERKLPPKVNLVTRKTAFREIYEPVTEANLSTRPTAAWPAATPTASGAARCTTSSRTGSG